MQNKLYLIQFQLQVIFIEADQALRDKIVPAIEKLVVVFERNP